MSGLGARGSLISTVCAIPVDCALEAGAEISGRGEAKAFLRARHVEHPSRLTVRLGWVEYEPSLESGEIRHELCQIPNADFKTGADIDRFRRIVALGRQHDRPRAVFDEEEFACRVPGPPALHFGCASLDGVDAFANQRRNDVRRLRIEVV